MPDQNNGQFKVDPNATDIEKAKAFSDYFGVPFIHLKGKDIPLPVFSKIPLEVCKDFYIVAYEFVKDASPQVLKIAVGDASRIQKKAPAILSELKRKEKINIELAITTMEDFDDALHKYSKLLDEKSKPVEENKKDAEKKHTEQKEDDKKSIKMIDLKNMAIPYDVLTKFPEEISSRYNMVVFEATNDREIKVAAVDPNDIKVKEILEFVKKRNNLSVDLYETSKQSVDWAIRGYLNKPQSMKPEFLEKKPMENHTSEIKLAKPIDYAEKSQVSDISEVDKKKSDEILKTSEPNSSEKTEKDASLKEENRQKEENKEKRKQEESEIKLSQEAPTVAIGDISFSELRQGVGARENVIPNESQSEESEKNLDKLLPQGVKNTRELSDIIKAGFIPKTLAAIIYLAVIAGASDVHIESEKKELRLRFRIDGLLKDIMMLPPELQAPIISRIKILSKLKIDETRIPQDGRFDIKVKDRDIDLRVSTLPTVNGEKAVLRILDKSAGVLSLEDLGMMGHAKEVLEKNIAKPFGVILSTGPTGSGKTTTLYSIINKINKPEINVITLEDPVEYEITGINQCQIKPKIGFGFADGLRSILRQDPNVIMVGEIRDQDTASLATHAALTGHLVLTTLHTNDTAGALPRLINMGVEPFLITSALNCIIAQRLVRKICEHCKEEYKIPNVLQDEIKNEIDKSVNPELNEFKHKDLKFYHGKGCSQCHEGYKGRIGLFEVMDMSDKIEELAVSRVPATFIKAEAIKEGMLTIKEDGLMKVLKGLTTIDEVMRVTTE